MIIKMSDIIKKNWEEPNPKIIKMLDKWLEKNRIYFVPGAKGLWDLFRRFSFKEYLDVVSKRSTSKLSEGDAAAIWKQMEKLLLVSPQLY